MISKAVIVAAGLSSRLYPLTKEMPKGLLKVGDTPILERSVKILSRFGIKNIAIVVGFKKEKIVSYLGKKVNYIFNPFYRHCNNMGSLWFSKTFVENSPFLYLHGDMIYEEEIIERLISSFQKSKDDIYLATDYTFFDEESMKVKTKKGYLIESSKEIPLEEATGEWIGISLIRSSRDLFKYIEKILYEDGLNFYDTYAFTKMAKDGYKIYCPSIGNLKWVEIDFLDDLKKAKELFEK